MSATSAAAGCSGRWSSSPTARRKAAFDPALKLHERVKREAFDARPRLLPDGRHDRRRRGDHVILAPPYIVTPDQVDMIVDRFGAAVDAALASCK